MAQPIYIAAFFWLITAAGSRLVYLVFVICLFKAILDPCYHVKPPIKKTVCFQIVPPLNKQRKVVMGMIWLVIRMFFFSTKQFLVRERNIFSKRQFSSMSTKGAWQRICISSSLTCCWTCFYADACTFVVQIGIACILGIWRNFTRSFDEQFSLASPISKNKGTMFLACVRNTHS